MVAGFDTFWFRILPAQLEILAEQKKFVVSGSCFIQG
jgi:hypothetical protein